MRRWWRSIGLALALGACVSQISHAGQHAALSQDDSSHCCVCHTANHNPGPSTISFQPLNALSFEMPSYACPSLERDPYQTDSPRGPPAL